MVDKNGGLLLSNKVDNALLTNKVDNRAREVLKVRSPSRSFVSPSLPLFRTHPQRSTSDFSPSRAPSKKMAAVCQAGSEHEGLIPAFRWVEAGALVEAILLPCFLPRLADLLGLVLLAGSGG